MGCFDYECECGGTTCAYVGGQNGGDSDVVVEVPLNDGTTVYVKGRYQSYGSVHAGEYQFYPEQFQDYFEAWLTSESDEARSNIFLAKRIWTFSYTHHEYDDETFDEVSSHLRVTKCVPGDLMLKVRIGTTTAKKFIRADKDLNIPSDDEKQKARIAKLKAQCELLQKELGRKNKP